MEILVAAAELAPYAVVSSAAETIASLSKALRLLGHDVTLALPRYPGFERSGVMAARRLTPLTLEGGAEVHLYDAQLASGTQLVLFDAPVLFERTGLVDAEGKPYADNAKRFGLYARAVEALVRSRSEQGSTFDVVHAHDWPGALALIHLFNSPGPAVAKVLTIHDPENSGTFALDEATALGVTEESCTALGVRRGQSLNVLLGGLASADAVTVPGERVVEELCSPDTGRQLGAALVDLGKPLLGILGGIDYAHYNPATDSLIETRYDAHDASRKAVNKTALVRELGLELVPGRLLLGVATEAERPEDSEIAFNALRKLLKQELSVVLLGPFHDSVRDAAQALASDYPEQCALLAQPDDTWRHKLLAASDIWLSANAYDSTATWVMRAQRYGAVPVALSRGPATEAIVDLDPELETGTGFLVDSMSVDGLVGGLRRALAASASPRWPSLTGRVMRRDLSWDRPARRYVQVFRQALSAKTQ